MYRTDGIIYEMNLLSLKLHPDEANPVVLEPLMAAWHLRNRSRELDENWGTPMDWTPPCRETKSLFALCDPVDWDDTKIRCTIYNASWLSRIWAW